MWRMGAGGCNEVPVCTRLWISFSFRKHFGLGRNKCSVCGLNTVCRIHWTTVYKTRINSNFNPVINIACLQPVDIDKLLYCIVLYLYCTLNGRAITLLSYH